MSEFDNDHFLKRISAEEMPRFEATVKDELNRQGIALDLLRKHDNGIYQLVTMRIRWEGWLARAVYEFNCQFGLEGDQAGESPWSL